MDPEEEGEDFDELEEFEEPEGEEPEAPEPGQEPEEEIEEPAPKPKSRAQARIEALDREAREAKEAAEALRREVEALKNGRQRSDADEQARRRRAELEAMDPWDRARAEAADAEARTNQRLEAIARRAADADDRAAFAERCAENPALSKVRAEVEKRLAEARSRGIDVPRETLATFILGEERLKSGPKAKARAERKAAANLDRERARPAAGASDAPRSGGAKDEKAARLARLENYRF